MNHKTKGFLLFEFLISSLLAATLLIIVYQSYETANKGVQYIHNHADFQMQKLLLIYQLEIDSMHIVIPQFVYDLYPQVKSYFNNKKDNKEADEKSDQKNNEQIKKKLEKDFQLSVIFFPELIHTKEEIKLSWISSRKILGKESLVKINYIFKLTDKIYKEKKLYRLYRREDSLEPDYSIKKIGTEYAFITYIIDPEINAIMPKIIIKSEEKTEVSENEKNEFFNWNKNPTFIVENKISKIELKEMHKKAIIPFTVFINGTMIAHNFSKKLDMQLAVSFPIADYALQILLHNDNKNETKKELPKNNFDDKKPNQLNKAELVHPTSLTPAIPAINEVNNLNAI